MAPTMSPDRIVIPARFSGPLGFANGGYLGGALARGQSGPIQVTYRKPCPLEVALACDHEGRALALRTADGTLIAEAEPGVLDEDVPAPPSFESAVDASTGYPWRLSHPYPGCFVCGTDRAEGDGLRLFPGPVHGARLVAAPWVPGPSLPHDEEGVHAEIAWAALDCPSLFGTVSFEEVTGTPLLGRIVADLVRRPRIGERCIVLGWPLGREGRKLFDAAALFGEDGELLGRSRATWILT